MRVTWLYSSYHAAGLAFRGVSIYDTNHIKNGKLLFYSGDSAKLINIYISGVSEVTIKHFTGTVTNFDTICREQFDIHIKPLAEQMKLYQNVLYSLDSKRPVIADDFSSLIPVRGKEIFFIAKEERDAISPTIYWFDKRGLSDKEDIACLDALSSWNSWGITSPPDAQTEHGKLVMVFLNEAKRTGSFPTHIAESKVKSTCYYLTFQNETDSYAQRMLNFVGEKFNKSLKQIYGEDTSGTIVDFGSLEEPKYIPYIREGKINLTELTEFNIKNFVRYMEDSERVEVTVDIQDLDIKRMTLVPGAVLITRANATYDAEYYQELLGIDSTVLLVSNDRDTAKG